VNLGAQLEHGKAAAKDWKADDLTAGAQRTQQKDLPPAKHVLSDAEGTQEPQSKTKIPYGEFAAFDRTDNELIRK